MLNNKYFQDLKVEIDENDNKKATFNVEPFERGYGVTIGNGLRRTLLTSLPGVAITSFKIDGVSHEFTSIEGVSEDLCDIILNLKKVRFKLDQESSSELINLSVQGPCDFKASALVPHLSNFKILNKTQHLATLNSDVKLDCEIRISRGKGYSIAEENKRTDDTLHTIERLREIIAKKNTEIDTLHTIQTKYNILTDSIDEFINVKNSETDVRPTLGPSPEPNYYMIKDDDFN